jgi:hypothetical protein
MRTFVGIFRSMVWYVRTTRLCHGRNKNLKISMVCSFFYILFCNRWSELVACVSLPCNRRATTWELACLLRNNGGGQSLDPYHTMMMNCLASVFIDLGRIVEFRRPTLMNSKRTACLKFTGVDEFRSRVIMFFLTI